MLLTWSKSWRKGRFFAKVIINYWVEKSYVDVVVCLQFWTKSTFDGQPSVLMLLQCSCGGPYITVLLLTHRLLNTSYLTDSYISFTLNLESAQNVCSNRSIRSSTYGKKNISDFPPCGKLVIFVNEFVIFLKTSK